eukprot:6491439-Amphidinium_carterae.2
MQTSLHIACANQESKSGVYDDNTDYSKSKLARPFCSKIVIMLCRLEVLAFRDPHSTLLAVRECSLSGTHTFHCVNKVSWNTMGNSMKSHVTKIISMKFELPSIAWQAV